MSNEYGIQELWRCKCLASGELSAIIGGRAYMQQISEMDQPEFPSLSLYVLNDPPSFAMTPVINGKYQMDSWARDRATARRIQEIIKGMFQRQNWSDDLCRILMSFCYNKGDVVYEDKSRVFHGYSIWNIRWLSV